MNVLKHSLAALGTAVLLATPALAQGPGMGMGMGSPVNLLGNASVVKELKLDEKQIEAAKLLAQETRDKMRAAWDGAQSLEGSARREKMQKVAKEINESSKPALTALLKPEQIKRLHQVWNQQRGAMAFSDPDVQKELKFSDAQQEKIKFLADSTNEKRREAFTSAGGDREAMREKMMSLNKEFSEKVQTVLTDDQKKAYKEFLGAPFEIVREPRPN